MSDTMPTVCHFCGSKVTILSDGSECKADDGSWIGFQCGTSWHKGYHNPRQLQSRPCEIDERDALKARIKRLEEAGDRLAGTTPPSSDRYMAWIKAKEAKAVNASMQCAKCLRSCRPSKSGKTWICTICKHRERIKL